MNPLQGRVIPSKENPSYVHPRRNNGLLEPSMAGVHFTPFPFGTGHCPAARIWVGRGIFLLGLRGGGRWLFGGASDD
jgi:hypothetical protein